MPELGDSVEESRDTSNIVPRSQERNSLRGKRSSGGDQYLLPALLLLLVLLGAGGGGWWLFEEWRVMTLQVADQQQRLLGIEGSLSSTHEDLSQSSESVAVGIRELYTEVDKLWDALRQDRKSAEGAEGVRALLREGLQSLEQTAERLRGEVAGIGVQVTALQEGVERSARLEGGQQKVRELLQSLQSTVQLLEQRVGASEEWVEGINAWRPELNERLLRLQEMAENLSRPSVPSSGGLQEEPL